MKRIGIIGGSGVYDLEALQDVSRKRVTAGFGEPSDEYVCGRINGVEVCFLPRHGVGHRLLPSEINHRANVMGFKVLGCQQVISISAVGSLREDIHPRDIVLPDQYFDRTKRDMEHTFFGNGAVAHVGFGHPTCGPLRQEMAVAIREVLARQPKESTTRLHEGGTYVNMEGPAFSTKAESNVYRSFGFTVIGMTSLGEAKLCREAEICYQSMAMVTDYDCWHETAEIVSVEMIIGHLTANTKLAKDILMTLLPRLSDERHCECNDALRYGLITRPASIPETTKEALRPIIGRYLG